MKSVMYRLLAAGVVMSVTLGAKAPPVTPESCLSGDAFHKAAARGDVNFVKACLQAGTPVNTQEGNGWTALHAAANKDQGQVMQILLRYDADPSVRDTSGRTALDHATSAKRTNAISVLKQHAAQPAMPISGLNGAGVPPRNLPSPPGTNGAGVPTPPAPMPGGLTEVSISDKAVIAAAEFAAEDLARWRPDPMTSPYLNTILKASTQVVAGTNYYLTIKTNDTDVYTWEVVVYKDLEGQMKITESKQL